PRKQALKNVLKLTPLLTFLIAMPQAAHAGPIGDAITYVVDILTGEVARSIAIIAVIILGFAALAGRLTGERAIQVIIGIAIVFGAATFVDEISGGTTGGGTGGGSASIPLDTGVQDIA
ncbi:MAG: TrbC/VirB2 family protein, partial [Flavobacteriales bacterium]|nr:TrbC/VirB2 family protein [Flavobacteriales bacterium]